MSLLICLTVYKRNNLELQLKAVEGKSKYLVVFQNEHHVDIEHLKEKYKFIHVKNDFNTKFFGRFSYCLNFDVDYCMIFDDDLIPGSRCVENYLNQCKSLGGIIGGNGRFCFDNPSYKSIRVNDTGRRETAVEVDFVGHLWCFRKEWLYHMFSIKPYTLETGEDMHLCFTSKVLGGIKCYVGKQVSLDEECDTTQNRLSSDQFASFKKTPPELRNSIQLKFIKDYNLKYVI